jgi:two-component system, NarL family, sensor histidine kinase UhpB
MSAPKSPYRLATSGQGSSPGEAGAVAVAGPASSWRLVWRALVGILLASGLLQGPVWATGEAPAAIQELREAVRVPGMGEAFPDEAPGVPLRLPAHGSTGVIGEDGLHWIRLSFDYPLGSDPLWAALIPLSCGAIEVVLNGQPLHRDPVAADLAPRCPQARWFNLPAAALRAGRNELDIRLHGLTAAQAMSVRRTPLLSAVRVGPAQALAEFRTTTAVRIVDVTLVLLGGFMLLLAANRHGRHLADFALAAWAWAAALSPVWWTIVPLRPLWLDLLLASLMAPALAFGVRFLMRFANQDLPRLHRLMFAQCLLLPLSLAVVAPDARSVTASVWMGLLGLELAAALGLYIGLRWRGQREDAWTMIGILAAVAVVWGLEAATLPEDLGRHGVAWVFGSPFGFGLMLVAVGVHLLNRFSRALVSAEESRQSLELRVQEITVQIENNFSQLSEMRVEQLTQKERKRIAADLHDDLGAKLLTIVHTCDNERIAALGREALDDMRLSVRGLNGKPMRLADAMADWRAETVQRLGQTNIQVEWRSPNDEVDSLLPARGFVQTTRILREAVSNIIKHSGASQCQVTCFATKGEFGIVIEDNGRGITVDYGVGLDRGNGLASMKNRAKQLQGQCLIESGPGVGTVIRLTLPL